LIVREADLSTETEAVVEAGFPALSVALAETV
jgi:hypothetical protein